MSKNNHYGQDIDDFIDTEMGQLDGSTRSVATSKPQMKASSISKPAMTSSKPAIIIAKKPNSFAKPLFGAPKNTNFGMEESADQEDFVNSELT